MLTVKEKHPVLKALLICALCLLIGSCRTNPTDIIIPPDGRPIITSQDFHNVILELTDYDVVHITHQSGLYLRSTDIFKIGIGTKDSTGYIQILSANSTYDTSAQAYIIHYDFTVRMDSSLIDADIAIRYFTSDSTFTDADTIFSLYTYPYYNVNIVVTDSIVPFQNSFQDIGRIGNKLFFHPLGPDGLYEYDLNTHQTKSLYGYSSGDHIAADSIFVFCDVAGHGIDRFNLLSDSVDLCLPSFVSSSPSIFGMATYNQHLFVLHNTQLEILNFDGVPLDTIPYPSFTYYMTIYDSIVYSVDDNSYPNQITRFDLRTKTFLSNLLSPAKSCDGIKVYENQFYFCNYNKRFVGAITIPPDYNSFP